MEEDEGWKMYRPAIVIVTILVLIIGSTFLYVFLERGLEGFIDWLADRIIGVMFAGLLAGAFVMFDKLSNKLSVIRMSMHEKRKVQQIPSPNNRVITNRRYSCISDDIDSFSLFLTRYLGSSDNIHPNSLSEK